MYLRVETGFASLICLFETSFVIDKTSFVANKT